MPDLNPCLESLEIPVLPKLASCRTSLAQAEDVLLSSLSSIIHPVSARVSNHHILSILLLSHCVVYLPVLRNYPFQLLARPSYPRKAILQALRSEVMALVCRVLRLRLLELKRAMLA